MAKPGPNLTGRKNKILGANPSDTMRSNASVNSMNLERINQRNADRLARLDNDQDLNDSNLFQSPAR